MSAPLISTHDQFVDENRDLPRSAVLVCDLTWAWGPAHGRSDKYSIVGLDREWTLWATTPNFDTGEPMKSIYAFGRWDEAVSKLEAARELLRAAWSNEWRLYDTPGKEFSCEATGLLGEGEIQEIADQVYVEDSDDDA